MTQAQLNTIFSTLQARVNKLDARLNAISLSGSTLYKLKYGVETFGDDKTVYTLRLVVLENRA